MKRTLWRYVALAALALASGTVTSDQGGAADQPAKTAAQLAIEQFIQCANSLFKDEFDPAEIDYELGASKESVLDLSVKWSSRDGAINIFARMRSIGSTPKRELIMTQSGESN